MKLLSSIVILCLSIICFSYAYADDIFYSKLFSVKIPKEIIIDDKKQDSLSLVFKNDSDLTKGTLSVSAKKGKPGVLDLQWRKIEPVLAGNKTVIFERYVSTAGLKWKTIGLIGKTSDYEIQDVIYYSVFNDLIYMINYHCPKDNCSEMESVFNKILASFKPVLDQ
jgi:hypothetical protein